ncbi:MAG: shikimate kinase [Pseudomonadota bacterium]|nr:shikimate kinase [Pseudomonadota bacterium]
MGRQLAKKLHLDFYDSDKVIEARTGASIPLIFELEGEAGFRQREQAVIDELTQLPGIVLATGGGAILREANRQHLKSRGTVIYLHSDISHLMDRIRHDRNRPLLQTADPEAKLRELMTQREPLYREAAHITINTGDVSIRAAIQAILERLKNHRQQTQA